MWVMTLLVCVTQNGAETNLCLEASSAGAEVKVRCQCHPKGLELLQKHSAVLLLQITPVDIAALLQVVTCICSRINVQLFGYLSALL
jgi:hypothetical protein